MTNKNMDKMSSETSRKILTLPPSRRPAWLNREGIVMAGSWEPLFFRARRDGGKNYLPTPEQRAAYEHEHSPAMVARLKSLGINFVMMHWYKGAGLKAERESMDDAVRFARLCRAKGLHVGVYVGSGTLFDLLYKEVPEAKDWLLLDGQGKTIPYAPYRHYWNRIHPEAAAYHRRIVEMAIREIQPDLIHCDNYISGALHDACSVERFRRFLAATFSAKDLAAMGITQLDKVRPPRDLNSARPPYDDVPELFKAAWREFGSRSLAESYHELTRAIRSLRPGILMECNPGGPGKWIRPRIDHGRLLQGGEAFWDEQSKPGYENGKIQSGIRTYKIARAMGNMAFMYSHSALCMAESMAFNRDCLGCVCMFENGKREIPGGKGKELPDKELAPFIRFFHERRELLRNAAVIADVAVLRSLPSQMFAGEKVAQLTYRAEEALIEARSSFQIIYDHQLENLRSYRALVLAGCVAMSDIHLKWIQRYVAGGGRLCVIGPVATHDAWNRPRPKPGLLNLPATRIMRILEQDDPVSAVRLMCGKAASAEVNGPQGLCAEFTRQKDRRMVHLVNYRIDQPARDVCIRLRLPAGRRVKTVMLAGPDHKQDRKLPFRKEGTMVVFTIPKIRLYEIAVVSLSPSKINP